MAVPQWHREAGSPGVGTGGGWRGTRRDEEEKGAHAGHTRTKMQYTPEHRSRAQERRKRRKSIEHRRRCVQELRVDEAAVGREEEAGVERDAEG